MYSEDKDRRRYTMIYTLAGNKVILVHERQTAQAIIRDTKIIEVYTEDDVDEEYNGVLLELGDVIFSCTFPDFDDARMETVVWMKGYMNPDNMQFELYPIEEEDVDVHLAKDMLESIGATVIYELCVNGESIDDNQYPSYDVAEDVKETEGYVDADIIAKVNAYDRLAIADPNEILNEYGEEALLKMISGE